MSKQNVTSQDVVNALQKEAGYTKEEALFAEREGRKEGLTDATMIADIKAGTEPSKEQNEAFMADHNDESI